MLQEVADGFWSTRVNNVRHGRGCLDIGGGASGERDARHERAQRQTAAGGGPCLRLFGSSASSLSAFSCLYFPSFLNLKVISEKRRRSELKSQADGDGRRLTERAEVARVVRDGRDGSPFITGRRKCSSGNPEKAALALVRVFAQSVESHTICECRRTRVRYSEMRRRSDQQPGPRSGAEIIGRGRGRAVLMRRLGGRASTNLNLNLKLNSKSGRGPASHEYPILVSVQFVHRRTVPVRA